jgi:hypothetical protein
MMKNTILITAVLLLISIGNFFGVISDGSIRTIDFFSILVIGALFGVLLTQIIITVRAKKK